MSNDDFHQLVNGHWVRVSDGSGPYTKTGPGAFVLASSSDAPAQVEQLAAAEVANERIGGGGATRMIIPAGYGFSRSSTYTVPAGRTLALRAFFGCINRSTTTDAVEISITLQSILTGVKTKPFEFSIRADPYAHDLKDAPSIVQQKTDVSFTVSFTANNNTNVSAAFAGQEFQNV